VNADMVSAETQDSLNGDGVLVEKGEIRNNEEIVGNISDEESIHNIEVGSINSFHLTSVKRIQPLFESVLLTISSALYYKYYNCYLF
jgi:hypothetical protein